MKPGQRLVLCFIQFFVLLLLRLFVWSKSRQSLSPPIYRALIDIMKTSSPLCHNQYMALFVRCIILLFLVLEVLLKRSVACSAQMNLWKRSAFGCLISYISTCVAYKVNGATSKPILSRNNNQAKSYLPVKRKVSVGCNSPHPQKKVQLKILHTGDTNSLNRCG